jgi:hypothetical protein
LGYEIRPACDTVRLRLILHILYMPQVASAEGYADCAHAGANHRKDSAPQHHSRHRTGAHLLPLQRADGAWLGLRGTAGTGREI